ncbi:PspC domain-containing protein [Mucilaginibacter sp. HD30]
MEKRLYRDELNKKVAGVCAGLAEYLNVDVTIVRVIFALAVVLKGVGLLPYIVLWIVLPKKPYHLSNPHVDYTVPPSNEPFNPFKSGVPPFNPGAVPPFAMKPKKSSSAGLIAGIALVLFGSFFLLEQLDVIPFLSFHDVWPVILIVMGGVIIFSGMEKKPKPVEEKWDAEEKAEAFKADADEINPSQSTEQ